MAANRKLSTTPTRNSRETTLKNTKKSSFRIQSAPPLSIQQFLRSATGVIVGHKEWKPSGKYQEPVFRNYLSPTVRQKPKPAEPVWHPPGAYKEKPITALSRDTKPQEHPKLPVWNPPGKFVPETVPYFDAPSLRWSLQDLLREMPEMRPKTFHASSRMSSARKSEQIHDT